MKILLAADGSDFTRIAALHLVNHVQWLAQPPEVHVLHVHAPLPYAGAAARAGKAAVDAHQRDESMTALAVAENVLAAAGIPYVSSWAVGNVAEQITSHVDKLGCDLVVMGSKGHGALATLVLGSVAAKYLATAKVPLMIARAEPLARARQEADATAARAVPAL